MGTQGKSESKCQDFGCIVFVVVVDKMSLVLTHEHETRIAITLPIPPPMPLWAEPQWIVSDGQTPLCPLDS